MIGIESYGIYIPKKRIHASQVAKSIGVSEFDIEKNGHVLLSIADGGETPSSMAIDAARNALDKSKYNAKDIDTIIYCGSHKDYSKWQASTCVQEGLNIECSNSFDLYQGCNTPIQALSISNSLIKSGSAKVILIVASEKWSNCTNGYALTPSIFVGDGAGAMIVSEDKNCIELLDVSFKSNGKFNDLWYIKSGGTEYSNCNDGDQLYKVQRELNSSEIEEFKSIASRYSSIMLNEVLENCGLKKSQIDYLIQLNGNERHNIHYQNSVDLKDVLSSRGFISEVGHLGGADFVYNLHRAIETGQIKKNDIVLSYSGGSGYSWATAMFRI